MSTNNILTKIVSLQVDNEFISVATLTSVAADTMRSVSSAPKILARVISKGAEFSNTPDPTDPDNTMLQVSVE